MLLEDGAVKDIPKEESLSKNEDRIFKDVESIKSEEDKEIRGKQGPKNEPKNHFVESEVSGLITTNLQDPSAAKKDPKGEDQIQSDGEKIEIGNNILICPRINIKWKEYNWPIFCKIGKPFF